MGHGWPEGFSKRQSRAQKKRFQKENVWNKGKQYGKSRWFWANASNEYRALHKRIQRKFGTPKKCMMCRKDNLQRYMWANVSGKYLEVKNDWIRICQKCHIKLDNSTIDKSYKNKNERKTIPS